MTKRGFCIGLNYSGTQYQLGGCENDARNLKTRMHASVTSYYVNQFEEVTGEISADDLFGQLAFYRETQKKSDVLFLTYSGHGTQLPTSMEADGYGEGICLFKDGQIEVVKDVDLQVALVQIPGSVIFIFDSCFSGGMSRDAAKPGYKRKFIEYDPDMMRVYNARQDREAKPIQTNKLYYLFACAEDEVSWDTGKAGLFTQEFCRTYDGLQKQHRKISTIIKQVAKACKPDQSPFYETFGGGGTKRIF